MATEDKKKDFKESLLNEKELADFKFVNRRIKELQDARKEEQFGVHIEDIWAAADRDFAPHRLTKSNKKTQDEDKGWRGQAFRPGYSSDWQSDISQPNPFIKIQIAQSILVDQNPTGIFTPTTKKYQKTTALIKQLYDRSWDYAKSKQQLKLFVHNLGKYGNAYGRTYPLRVVRKVKNLVEYNQEEPDKSVYEEKEVTEFNDIFRENLDPWNVWIDDMAKPNNHRSVRDWAWRKVYSMDKAEEEFGSWKFWKYVKSGGTVTDKLDEKERISKKFTEKDLVEVLFYENAVKDMFWVVINGVPVISGPLPISDSIGIKKLSLWWAYWNLRHAECPYGIGIYEAIRYDQGILDRIRNMTIDQLTLSIYKMFFYQGTNQLTETGDIAISPGVGKQTLDPKNIQFMEIPGPGREAFEGIQMFKSDLDEASGITDPLMGQVTGKTAFEIAQAKESALKRLKTPLENITDALDNEAYITVSLIQILYSIPEIYKISDPTLMDEYLHEIKSDPELYRRTDTGDFEALVYKEFPLNLDEDEQGNLIEKPETQFFRVKPQNLKWEGIINVKSQSVLTPSKALDKTQNLELYNMLIPLLAQPPEIFSKIAQNMVKDYDKDPKDLLPAQWLMEPEEMQAQMNEEQPLFIPAEQAQQMQAGQVEQQVMQQMGQAPQAQTAVPSTQVGKPNMIGQFASKLGGLFR